MEEGGCFSSNADNCIPGSGGMGLFVSNREAQKGPWSRWLGPHVYHTIIQKRAFGCTNCSSQGTEKNNKILKSGNFRFFRLFNFSSENFYFFQVKICKFI